MLDGKSQVFAITESAAKKLNRFKIKGGTMRKKNKAFMLAIMIVLALLLFDGCSKVPVETVSNSGQLNTEQPSSEQPAQTQTLSYDKALSLLGGTKEEVFLKYGQAVFMDHTQGNTELEPYICYDFDKHRLFFRYNLAGEYIETIQLISSAGEGEYDKAGILGVTLGMTRTEAEGILGKGSEMTGFTEGETLYSYIEYTLGDYFVSISGAYENDNMTDKIDCITVRLANQRAADQIYSKEKG